MSPANWPTPRATTARRRSIRLCLCCMAGWVRTGSVVPGVSVFPDGCRGQPAPAGSRVEGHRAGCGPPQHNRRAERGTSIPTCPGAFGPVLSCCYCNELAAALPDAPKGGRSPAMSMGRPDRRSRSSMNRYPMRIGAELRDSARRRDHHQSLRRETRRARCASRARPTWTTRSPRPTRPSRACAGCPPIAAVEILEGVAARLRERAEEHRAADGARERQADPLLPRRGGAGGGDLLAGSGRGATLRRRGPADRSREPRRGAHLPVHPRAARPRRGHRALQLPAQPDRAQAGSGRGRRHLGRAQAAAPVPADRPRAGRDPARGRPARRAR